MMRKLLSLCVLILSTQANAIQVPKACKSNLLDSQIIGACESKERPGKLFFVSVKAIDGGQINRGTGSNDSFLLMMTSRNECQVAYQYKSTLLPDFGEKISLKVVGGGQHLLTVSNNGNATLKDTANSEVEKMNCEFY